MGAYEAFDLGALRRSSRRGAENPVRKLLSMVLLLAIKDRATEVRYEPRLGEESLRYRVDGTLYTLTPPPQYLAPYIIDELRSLARPRGLRSDLARLLRALARRLEGSTGTGSYVQLKLDHHYLGVEMMARDVEGSENVVLFINPTDDPVIRDRAIETLHQIIKEPRPTSPAD